MSLKPRKGLGMSKTKEEWFDISADKLKDFGEVLKDFDDSYSCKGQLKFRVREEDDEIVSGKITLVFTRKEE